MADDDMEISSDPGYHGNDDIDIDIDFTTGDADGDGDYMVDDAPLELGLEETLDIPALTPMDNDDYFEGDDTAMFDEAGNENKKVEDVVGVEAFVPMSDASFSDLDHVASSYPPVSDSSFILGNITDAHMSTTDPVLEFSNEQSSSAEFTSKNATTNFIDGNYEQQTLTTTHDSIEETTHAEAVASTHRSQTGNDSEEIASVAYSNLAYEVIDPSGNNDSAPSRPEETTGKLTPSPDLKTEQKPFEPLPQESTLLQEEQTIDTKSVNNTEESLTSKESTSVNALRSPPTSNPGTGTGSPSHKTSDRTNNESTTVVNGFSNEANVTMVWQNAEYTLFPRLESDDPDSFFLSDQKILERPLNDFLQSIRDVIREEITDEDELCMAIEDLGLEIEETSAHLGMYTLGQIIDVFNKLLENDSAPVRPLYVNLTARPSFLRRYGICLAGVADGRGLSNVIVYGTGSESHHELLDGDDRTGNNLSIRNDAEAHSFSDDPEDEKTAEPTADDETHLEFPKRPLNLEEPGIAQEDNKSQANEDYSVSMPEFSARDFGHVNESHEPSEDETSVVNNQHQGQPAKDDDDLLDYSEDEFEEPKAQSNSSQTGSELGANVSGVENDTELGGENNPLPENTAVEDQQDQNEESYLTRDQHDGENDTGGEDFENDYIDAGEESLGNDHNNDTDTWDEYDDEAGKENVAQEHGLVEESLTIETGHGSNTQDGAFDENDEFQFFEGEPSLGEGTCPVVVNYDFEENDDTNQHHELLEVDPSKFGLESVDTVDSSATLSADEPHEENAGEHAWQYFEDVEPDVLAGSNDNGKEDEDEDEIGYEDDEKDAIIDLPPIDSTPNSLSKRSISEMEADGLIGLESPESKRPRS
ncbi:hypothetical protein BJ875DRAFT_484989 [Amylocarpus encephaloides]|uniref:Uncharacterized protein n=1 Tax=Amylocarpus encephaloides TaxID=45428 RepID=A0A9P7YHL0_9HELO|nr:hypothetical protein BJ875DRAFT_484989 [Amylocarpus encephaloides]